METIQFPKTIIIDARNDIMEFMNIFKSGERLNSQDIVFIEETLTAINMAFIDIKDYNQALPELLTLFADCVIRYSDDDLNNPTLLVHAVIDLSNNLQHRLINCGVYVNGFFPYTFKQLCPDLSIMFELADEYIGDRYIDPYKVYQQVHY